MQSSKIIDSNKPLRSTAGSNNTEAENSVKKVQNQKFLENEREIHEQVKKIF